LQRSCVKYMNHAYPTVLITHVPNGGYRSPIEAAIFKGLGVKAGFPDLFIFRATGKYHGLAIELKAPGKIKNVSDNQKECLKRLAEVGYKATLLDTLEDFIEVVDQYLTGKS